jgi:hypothetical protein
MLTCFCAVRGEVQATRTVNAEHFIASEYSEKCFAYRRLLAGAQTGGRAQNSVQIGVPVTT